MYVCKLVSLKFFHHSCWKCINELLMCWPLCMSCIWLQGCVNVAAPIKVILFTSFKWNLWWKIKLYIVYYIKTNCSVIWMVLASRLMLGIYIVLIQNSLFYKFFSNLELKTYRILCERRTWITAPTINQQNVHINYFYSPNCVI